MELLLSDGAPSGVDLPIQSLGKYYAANTTVGALVPPGPSKCYTSCSK